MGYRDPYGPPPGPPTKVMGRRVVAYLIDTLIVLGVSGVLFAAVSDRIENPFEIDCQDVQDEIDGVCVNVGDEIRIAEDGEAALVFAASLATGIAISVVLQGLTGATPGKAITGVRVVRGDGRPVGLGRGLLRWVVSFVDAFPWCIPMLLGFIVAMTSDTRQRLADRAVSSYVVRSSAAGRPLDLPGAAPWGGGPPPSTWGQPGQPWGQQPAGQPGQAWGQPGGQWGAPPPGQPWGAPPPAPPPPGGWGPPPAPPSGGQWGPG